MTSKMDWWEIAMFTSEPRSPVTIPIDLVGGVYAGLNLMRSTVWRRHSVRALCAFGCFLFGLASIVSCAMPSARDVAPAPPPVSVGSTAPPAPAPSAAPRARATAAMSAHISATPLYNVWYGTNRKPVDSNASGQGYSSEREQDSRTIHYGRCTVTIPESHKFGEVGSGWWKRLWMGTDDRLKLRDILPASEAEFWTEVAVALEKEGAEGQAVVYIHGYNVDFEAAAIRAAQIGFDLEVPLMAFFSWPSRGSVDDYMADEATIEASESAITTFLTRFATEAKAERIHIIAHSMGNRGLLRAMERIRDAAERGSPVKFGQILLAAPDVDAQVFSTLATVYSRLAARTTLYVSPADKAVELSKWLHGAPRAGFTPPVTLVEDIDTVEVPSFDLTGLGHSYYAEAEDVLHDMFVLLHSGTGPQDRQRLQRKQVEDGRPYWTFKP